jgi:hypothetical protein
MRRTTLPAPLTILGYRKDGRPIRVIAGGAEDGGQGGDGGNGGAAGGSADQNGQGSGQTAAQGSNQNGNQNGNQQGTPFDHITDIGELRALAARQQHDLANQGSKSREQARAAAAEEARQKLTQDIAKALGLTNDAKDPAELERQIARMTADQLEKDRELTIVRAALAPGMNVDVTRLLDSRSFMRSMSDVDPNADGAAEAITDRIKKAVSSDPSLQLRHVSGGGSVGHAGGAGDHTKPDLSKLHGDQLIEAAYAANAAQK